MRVKHLVKLLLVAWMFSASVMAFLGHFPDTEKKVSDSSFIEIFTMVGVTLAVIALVAVVMKFLSENWNEKII